MKVKNGVIKRNNIPTRLPITSSALAWLLMDYYSAPLWFKGSVLTLFAIYWLLVIVILWQENSVNLVREESV